jgi:hypothetical protein
LHLIGVNHFDPLQRLKLIASLQSLSARYQMPAFVGVEFDKDLFDQTEYPGKWALSITGAGHTNASTTGSMAALCESWGLACERTVLC